MQVSSMQLMDNYCPYAAGLLCFLVPVFEPLGIDTPLVKQHTVTLFSFPYTPIIVGAIALTAVLGLLVSLSTFLVIGATSSLTYNVVSRLTTQATLLSFPYTPVIIRVINLTAVLGVLVSLSAFHVIEALMGLTYHAVSCRFAGPSMQSEPRNGRNLRVQSFDRVYAVLLPILLPRIQGCLFACY